MEFSHTFQISELWIPISSVHNANAYLLCTFWFLPVRFHVVLVKPSLSHPCLIPIHSLLKSILLCHQNCFSRIDLLTLTTAPKFFKNLQLLAYKALQAGCEPDFLASSPTSWFLLLLECTVMFLWCYLLCLEYSVSKASSPLYPLLSSFYLFFRSRLNTPPIFSFLLLLFP